MLAGLPKDAPPRPAIHMRQAYRFHIVITGRPLFELASIALSQSPSHERAAPRAPSNSSNTSRAKQRRYNKRDRARDRQQSWPALISHAQSPFEAYRENDSASGKFRKRHARHNSLPGEQARVAFYIGVAICRQTSRAIPSASSSTRACME